MKKSFVLSMLVLLCIAIAPKSASATATIVGSDTSDFAKNTADTPGEVKIKNTTQTK